MTPMCPDCQGTGKVLIVSQDPATGQWTLVAEARCVACEESPVPVCHPCHGTGKNHDETARCEYCGGSGATRTMLADDDEASSPDDTDFEPTQPEELGGEAGV